MAQDLCFYVDEKELYLEKVLVEYMDVPIFFVCTAADEYYLVICTDIYESVYIIVGISLSELRDLLYGKLSIQNAFMKKKVYWKVFASDEPKQDIVEERPIADLDVFALPNKDAVFETVTNELKAYAEEIDKKLS